VHADDCLFCKIVLGAEPSNRVLETNQFLIIKNKFPKAPVHVLVLDKQHRRKSDTISGAYQGENYWESMFDAINKALVKLGLDKTGYELVSNGAGYNHFEHEHFHIMGGYKDGIGPRT